MGEIRHYILRQQLQKELESAHAAESKGNDKEAGEHYVKAGAIARKLAYIAPREHAEEFFHSASQLENKGNVIRTTEGRDRAENTDLIDSMLVTQKPATSWDDIGGLEEAKHTLKEAIILPFIKARPDFVKITKSILLYGPPGTGKTLLAKASSNTLNATFFEAKASGLLSKYFGESSKIISSLFSKASEKQPSVIFMDEIDSLAPSRSSGIDESSRRVLGEILEGMDGFSARKDDKVIFIGATNKPWDLDDALLSRFQRKIYVPLPGPEARRSIFEIHLRGAGLNVNISDLVKRSEGYSGRDIAALCQHAISGMVKEENPGLEDLTSKQLESFSLKTRPLLPSDFDSAFEKIKPSCDAKSLEKYSEWENEFA
ncbi:MAG: ATP-binding protein [Candidatus Aenigmarchaeota archaeon]|nr:ATP-binding protein [Candidatus Aenigmarchaeota archaeon]